MHYVLSLALIQYPFPSPYLTHILPMNSSSDTHGALSSVGDSMVHSPSGVTPLAVLVVSMQRLRMWMQSDLIGMKIIYVCMVWKESEWWWQPVWYSPQFSHLRPQVRSYYSVGVHRRTKVDIVSTRATMSADVGRCPTTLVWTHLYT